MMNTYFSQSLSFPRHKFSISNLILLLLLWGRRRRRRCRSAEFVFVCARSRRMYLAFQWMEWKYILLFSIRRQDKFSVWKWYSRETREGATKQRTSAIHVMSEFLSAACLPCARGVVFVIALCIVDSYGYEVLGITCARAVDTLLPHRRTLARNVPT